MLQHFDDKFDRRIRLWAYKTSITSDEITLLTITSRRTKLQKTRKYSYIPTNSTFGYFFNPNPCNILFNLEPTGINGRFFHLRLRLELSVGKATSVMCTLTLASFRGSIRPAICSEINMARHTTLRIAYLHQSLNGMVGLRILLEVVIEPDDP